MKHDLKKLIEENPGAIFTVDNDHWRMRKAPHKPLDDMTDEEWEEYHESGELANANNVIAKGSGYGSGCSYGGDILQALAEIVGVKVESV